MPVVLTHIYLWKGCWGRSHVSLGLQWCSDDSSSSTFKCLSITLTSGFDVMGWVVFSPLLKSSLFTFQNCFFSQRLCQSHWHSTRWHVDKWVYDAIYSTHEENEDERNNMGMSGCCVVTKNDLFLLLHECWSGKGAQRAWWCLVVGHFNTPPPQALFVKKKAIRESAPD